MHTMVKRAAAGAVLGGSLVFAGGLGIASAAPPANLADGLVNIEVGNVTLAKGITANDAQQVLQAVCPADTLNNVNVDALANQVDQNGAPQSVGTCTLPGGAVTLQDGANMPANPAAPGQAIAPGQTGAHAQHQ